MSYNLTSTQVGELWNRWRFALRLRRVLRLIGFAALFLTLNGPDACERCDGPACKPLRCDMTTCRGS